MSSHVECTADSCRVRLEGELTIYTARELKDTLLATVARGLPMEVDLSGVTEMDSAGMQLLILLKREMRARGLRLDLAGHSPVVTEVIDLMNLAGFLGDPIVVRRRRNNGRRKTTKTEAGRTA